MPYPPGPAIEVSVQQSIRECMDCQNICAQTGVYCLHMGFRYSEAAHLERLLDCAGLCRASADFMSRGSALYPQLCDLCADACEMCAASCSRFDGDTQLSACAEACRRCAESCRDLARIRN